MWPLCRRAALLPSAEGGVDVMVVGRRFASRTQKKVQAGAREADKVQILSGAAVASRW